MTTLAPTRAFARRVSGVVPRKTLLGVVALAVALAGWWVAGLVGAPTRVSDELWTLATENPTQPFDIQLTLQLGPTRFHMDRYQDFGQLGRTGEKTLVLQRVDGADVKRIARDYWIVHIDLYQR